MPKDLSSTAKNIRSDLIKMLERSAWGSATCLGMVDILVALYFGGMNHDATKPDWKDRDRLVLSNTHCAPALYATLAHAGYFSKKTLLTFTQRGSTLQGRPTQECRGVEIASGNPGNGLSIACGISLGAKMEHRKNHTFCTLGDGEHQTGTIWEAALFASKEKLRLTALVDRNNIQGDGNTEHVNALGDLGAKYRAFGWHTIEVDGHNIAQMLDAIAQSKRHTSPTAIIAHTTSGKGVKFIHHDHHWHKPFTHAQATLADAHLRHEAA